MLIVLQIVYMNNGSGLAAGVELAAVSCRLNYILILVALRQESYNYHFTTFLAPGVLQSSRKTLMLKSG